MRCKVKSIGRSSQRLHHVGCAGRTNKSKLAALLDCLWCLVARRHAIAHPEEKLPGGFGQQYERAKAVAARLALDRIDQRGTDAILATIGRYDERAQQPDVAVALQCDR